MSGIIGKKLGMSSFYDDEGTAIPVTILEAGPCVIVQVKNNDVDGYNAVQLGYEDQKEHRVNAASLGRFKNAGIQAKRILREFRTDSIEEKKVGDMIDVTSFNEISFVDVISTGKGRGFQGVMKRFNVKGGPASHGSMFHRRIGSIGLCQWPGHVFKNQKMPGRMGGRQRTVQNLKVVKIDAEKNLILVKGGIPGANGDTILVRSAIKGK